MTPHVALVLSERDDRIPALVGATVVAISPETWLKNRCDELLRVRARLAAERQGLHTAAGHRARMDAADEIRRLIRIEAAMVREIADRRAR